MSDNVENTEVVSCPDCDGRLAKLSKVDPTPEKVDDAIYQIAPNGKKKETLEAFKAGTAGAIVGGAVGAVLGPAGVAAGVTLGSAGGSMIAHDGRLEVECENCGGSRLIDEKYVK